MTVADQEHPPARVGQPLVMAGVVQRIVAENLGVYRASAGRLQEDVSQEAQVASDYRGRLVYELLQNADDAMAAEPSHDDRVAFVLREDELWVANTGRALTEADVKGLCGLGASSKAGHSGPRRASIGHKGLGFKSVLEITDRPEVYSASGAFQLGPDGAQAAVTALWAELGRDAIVHVPAMRFPQLIESTCPVWEALSAEGYRTAFRFPFADRFDLEHRRRLGELLQSLPLTTVLFLKHLEHVDLRVELAEPSREQWRVRRHLLGEGEAQQFPAMSGSGIYRVEVSAKSGPQASFLLVHDADIEIGAYRVGLSGPAWDGIERTEVSVAVLDPATAAPMPSQWRRFHVFLPTQEVNNYPLLVNGAFATDLSRRHVSVSKDPLDYNGHLVRSCARLFADAMLPVLAAAGVPSLVTALDRQGEAGGAAELLHDALTQEIAALAFLPAQGDMCTPAEVALPSLLCVEDGGRWREMMAEDAAWEGQRLADAELCRPEIARVLVDHGVTELDPQATLRALAHLADPLRSALTPHPSGRYEIDPLLEVVVNLWSRSDPQEQSDLQTVLRELPLFPTHRHDDGTVDRVALGQAVPFFPPRAAKQENALHGLQFLCHAVCWGSLSPPERRAELEDQLNLWARIFGIREFDFPEVVRAAVLPGLVLDPDERQQAMRAALRDPVALAAICDLAGRTVKPDRPLRYQRLDTDKALYTLARLPVPCRSDDGTPRWEAAYRVYFGADWIGEQSVEHLLAALPPDDPDRDTLQPLWLAPPEELLGLLDAPQVQPEPPVDDAAAASEDEAVLDDDTEQALEDDARQRWLAFLTWIGVNQALRLVHFHDLEESGKGWLTAKNMAQPAGHAFARLGDLWSDFRDQLLQAAARAGTVGVDQYLYSAHDIDMAEPLLAAVERDASSELARRLMGHLTAHWPRLASLADAEIALVPYGKVPSMRSTPRAYADELREAGDNLWLRRLKQRGICPTSMGPRRPHSVWQQSPELDRRFSRQGLRAEQLLPVLGSVPGSPNLLRQLCDRLEVRRDLTRETFGARDAALVCEGIHILWPQPSPGQLQTIKGLYRNVFELLAGSSSPTPELHQVPLLASTPGGLRYRFGPQVLYAATPGARERSGVGDRLTTFVLEAEPSVAGPIVGRFGARRMESSLRWEVQSEPVEIGDAEYGLLRRELDALVDPLLARLRVQRSGADDAARDSRTVQSLLSRLQPARRLELACFLDDEPLGMVQREYYVVDNQAQVLWSEEQVWPPLPESSTALAMALADALEVSLVEAFDSLILADEGRRERLLRVVGADHYLLELRDEAVPATDADPGGVVPTPAPGAPDVAAQLAPPTGADVVAAPRPVPLRRADSLFIAGEPVVVAGDVPPAGPMSQRGGGGNGVAVASGGRRAAPGTDLKALDALGMHVTMSFERHRLLKAAARPRAVTEPDDDAQDWVVAVDTSEHLQEARAASRIVAAVLDRLARLGIDRLYPGFDVLTIRAGQVDRMIELKSSGVDARVQEMSWNEWKSAAGGGRQHFWLYLVGNLRADLAPDAEPFLRAVHDPFGSLEARQVENQSLRRAVQLRVREFAEAEMLTLTPTGRRPR